MNEEQARAILGSWITEDNRLECGGFQYLRWTPRGDLCGECLLDGEFTTEQLAAIVWWMKEKSET